MRIPAALKDAVRDRHAVLFAGAGISAKVLGVTGQSLRDIIGARIKEDYGNYDVEKRTFEDVCDEYQAINDRTALVNYLAEQIPQDQQPSVAHLTAVHLFRYIVTTNWDLLFETAYRQSKKHYQLLIDDHDAPNFHYDQANLLKIHGSVDRPLTLICTTEDYEAYPDTRSQILERVSQLLSGSTTLFVGYGLRDEHVRALLSRITRTRGRWARRAYAVGFYDEVRTKLLDLRNIQVIEADADTFLSELSDSVDDQGAKRTGNNTLTRAGEARN